MLDILNYLKEINKYNYALTKTDVPYMPSDFPNNYPIGKDMDMYVSSVNFSDICKITKYYFKNINYDKKIVKKNNNWKLRIEENNKLHYQIDITIDDNMINDRILKNNYYILSLKNEIKIRQNEVNKNPHKKHHKEWLVINLKNIL